MGDHAVNPRETVCWSGKERGQFRLYRAKERVGNSPFAGWASERCPAAPTAAVGGSLRGAQRLWLPKGSSISWRLELEGAEAECRYRTPADC